MQKVQSAFAETSDGLKLTYTEQDTLLLSGLTLAELTEGDILTGSGVAV